MSTEWREWREWQWQRLTSEEERRFPSGVCVCCKHKSPVLLPLPIFLEREWAWDMPLVEFRWVNGGHHEYRVVDVLRDTVVGGLDAYGLVCWFAKEATRRRAIVLKTAHITGQFYTPLYLPYEDFK